jgi:hypothetical protein
MVKVNESGKHSRLLWKAETTAIKKSTVQALDEARVYLSHLIQNGVILACHCRLDWQSLEVKDTHSHLTMAKHFVGLMKLAIHVNVSEWCTFHLKAIQLLIFVNYHISHNKSEILIQLLIQHVIYLIFVQSCQLNLGFLINPFNYLSFLLHYQWNWML